MTATRIDCGALAAVYGHGADAYDAVWSPVILPAAVSVVEAMQLANTSRVLDVGAGTGALTNALRAAAPHASVVSLDPAAQMLQIAHRRGATAVVADAAAIPCHDASVDAVLLAYVLFHLLDPAAALREAARALRLGGTIGTVTWASETQPPASKVWDRTLDELGVPSLPAHGNHSGLETIDAISALVGTAGLDPVRVWVHDLAHTFTPEQFWHLRTGSGCNRARLAALGANARASVLAALRTRLDRLTTDDYTFHGAVICSVSQKPTGERSEEP
jgi:SAM-dependent methyltransferase